MAAEFSEEGPEIRKAGSNSSRPVRLVSRRRGQGASGGLWESHDLNGPVSTEIVHLLAIHLAELSQADRRGHFDSQSMPNSTGL